MADTLTCPERQHKNKVPPDCHETDQYHEVQCAKCEKYFAFTVEYWPSYSVHKVDCANGSPHDWQPIVGWPREHFENQRRCRHCQEERSVEWIASHAQAT